MAADTQTAEHGRLLESVRPWGRWAALLASALNLVWLGSMIALARIGEPTEQAAQAPGLFRLSLGACVLLTLCQLPILITLSLVAAERSRARALIGGSCYALYLPLNLAAYYLYGMVFTRIAGAEDGAELLRPLLIALDVGRPYALFGNLPLLGYGLLGTGWCLLGSAIWQRSRLYSWVAAALVLAGGLSVIGAVGSFLDLDPLALGTLAGGVVSVPALGLLAAALWRQGSA